MAMLGAPREGNVCMKSSHHASDCGEQSTAVVDARRSGRLQTYFPHLFYCTPNRLLHITFIVVVALALPAYLDLERRHRHLVRDNVRMCSTQQNI